MTGRELLNRLLEIDRTQPEVLDNEVRGSASFSDVAIGSVYVDNDEGLPPHVTVSIDDHDPYEQ